MATHDNPRYDNAGNLTRRDLIDQARELVSTDQFARVELALSSLAAAIDAAVEATGRTSPEVVVTRSEFQWLCTLNIETNLLSEKVRERHSSWLAEPVASTFSGEAS